jgi:type II secretory pathway component PulC
MSDAPRGAVIAIGAAVVALVTSVAAVIVVVSRKADATPAPKAAAADELTVVQKRVPADEVAKLKRPAVEAVTDKGKTIGVKVVDAKLRAALGLAADDVITAIAGRTIKREFDVYDAVLGMSLMDSSVVYVDVVRAGTPQLVRWQLDGDLRSARRATDVVPPSPIPTPPPTIDPLAPNPFAPDPDDQSIIDSVRKLDDTHVEIPRSTVDRVLTNPMAIAKGARIVPAMKNGRPDGMKLYAIRPSSLWAALGFQNGDTVHSINGVELDDASKALDAYTKLRDATRLEIELSRRGRPETLVITIR